ncbi:hypothetical protein [Serratia marcescens]|uniref:hypothetical protein n=1 Tax=Serratia marcescens TaxID=615 RepID=UPI003D6FCA27
MLKTFQVSGYAVNKRGNTVAVRYEVQASNVTQAKQTAEQVAAEQGFTYPRLPSAVTRRKQNG